MKISETRNEFLSGRITKPDYIESMYQSHHAMLFDYADYIKQTNISSIEITDDSVIMTSRDKRVKMLCPRGIFVWLR